MEKTHSKSTLKFVKSASQFTTGLWSTNSEGMPKDEFKDKSKSCQKSPTMENTKAQEVKLHTQQRATKRAMFNYMVATKLSILEQQRKQEEMLQKMIAEEEIRLLRKEMVPRAQLMPFFDRPFIPQRSSRPLTIPREPSFRMMSSKGFSCNSGSELYNFQPTTQAMNPIK
ncbi:protein TPX2-like isoform X1 [Pyrus x bretschneideri]|uniref:protein TPX2-like isoform X1 n=1 Tax=Pyrus x bretschneideri TaxID=225117 RepID=UPI00202EC7AA|nr:protein TPX2-like isoform X1 [Pyrus x bretschneideri]